MAHATPGDNNFRAATLFDLVGALSSVHSSQNENASSEQDAFPLTSRVTFESATDALRAHVARRARAVHRVRAP
jgi:hypothetical protein